MSLLDFASKELLLLEKRCETENELKFQKKITKEVLEIMRVLYKYKHNGIYPQYITKTVNKLLNYEPLSCLTGADDEWAEKDYVYQNKRYLTVFKNKDDGRVYNINGYIYKEPFSHDYVCITDEESIKDIEFPCWSDMLVPEKRILFFPVWLVPIKWARRFHLYRKVK